MSPYTIQSNDHSLTPSHTHTYTPILTTTAPSYTHSPPSHHPTPSSRCILTTTAPSTAPQLQSTIRNTSQSPTRTRLHSFPQPANIDHDRFESHVSNNDPGYITTCHPAQHLQINDDPDLQRSPGCSLKYDILVQFSSPLHPALRGDDSCRLW
jgi:hypothetical protein